MSRPIPGMGFGQYRVPPVTRPCPWCCDIRTTPDEPHGQPVDHDGRPVTRLAPPHPECVAELDAYLDQEKAQ